MSAYRNAGNAHYFSFFVTPKAVAHLQQQYSEALGKPVITKVNGDGRGKDTHSLRSFQAAEALQNLQKNRQPITEDTVEQVFKHLTVSSPIQRIDILPDQVERIR